MSVLRLLTKPKKTHHLGVCVPEHQKEKIELEIKEIEKEKKKQSVENNAFEVSGYYEVWGNAMLKGTLLSGRITSKNKIVVDGKEIKIKEIQFNGRKAKALQEGETGALFLNAKGLRIEAGQVIEIK